MTDTSDYSSQLAFAKDLALQAGGIMRQYFWGNDQQVTQKADTTLVTVADTTINQLVIDQVNARFPQHGVRGEEASVRLDSNELWVCDPIDGTNGFTTGEPTAVFSLAYVVDGVPTVAVTLDPFQNRLYSAVKGQGTLCNDEPVHVSQRDVQGALIAGPGSFGEIDRTIDLFRALRDAGMRVRMFGGAVFKGNLIADGRMDGFVFPHRGAHDMAALKLIIEEAGGKMTDIEGNEQRYDQPLRGAVASNGVIHEHLLQAVQAHGIDKLLK